MWRRCRRLASEDRGSTVAYLVVALFILVAVFRPALVSDAAYRLSHLSGVWVSQLALLF